MQSSNTSPSAYYDLDFNRRGSHFPPPDRLGSRLTTSFIALPFEEPPTYSETEHQTRTDPALRSTLGQCVPQSAPCLSIRPPSYRDLYPEDDFSIVQPQTNIGRTSVSAYTLSSLSTHLRYVDYIRNITWLDGIPPSLDNNALVVCFHLSDRSYKDDCSSIMSGFRISQVSTRILAVSSLLRVRYRSLSLCVCRT